MKVEVTKDGDEVFLTLDPDSYDPYSPDALSAVLDSGQAERLIRDLYAAFPEIETPAQALDRGYRNAKKHVQFPVCACRFSDDEETVISPCLAHKLWKERS